MDISVQTKEFGGYKPPHPFGGDRPDDLPISAAVWDTAARYPRGSAEVVAALYEAVKHLEAHLVEARGKLGSQ